ncbi:MAG TPA: hypothetical protein VGH28_31605 [Polyangiaceae bacterium]|jgi:small nuclear ribonucleoprotein (snRNP)-like protein
MQRFAAALVAVCVLAPATARADVDDSALDAVLGGEVAVTLRNGTEAKGTLVSFTRTSIMIDDASVARSDVVALRLVSAPPIDENALRAAMGARVVVRLRDGREISGKLLAFTPEVLTLVGDDTIVRTVPRGELRALRHRALGRKFGIELGMLPGIMADADIGLFRAYVSGAFFFPAVTSGNIWGFSAGAGVGIPISPSTPALKIDVLAHANLLGVGSSCSVCGYPTAHTVAVGLAVGVHTTLDSGFTIGVMVPVIGWSATPDYHGTTNTAVSYYFISSGVSMAIGYMGYRF